MSRCNTPGVQVSSTVNNTSTTRSQRAPTLHHLASGVLATWPTSKHPTPLHWFCSNAVLVAGSYQASHSTDWYR